MSRFSTKSAYNFRPLMLQSYPGFEPKKVWAIFRHGTRLPGRKVIAKYKNLVAVRDEILKKSRHLSDEQREAFERWQPMEMKIEHQKYLTTQGEQELLALGSRFRKRFATFFDGNTSFVFKHTPTQRTKVSAEKLIDGLFPSSGKDKHKPIVVDPNDPILNPHKRCTSWLKNLKLNKDALRFKKRKFEISDDVTRLVSNIREFAQVDLNIHDLEQIFTIAAFETAWQHKLFNGRSIWCSIFQNEQQLKIMEYLRDLESYWSHGYGFEITKNDACETVEDIFKQLDSSVDDKTMSFYFTHSGSFLKLLTCLELHRDQSDLTAANLRDDRLWKTSQIDTYASNLVVILYESQFHEPHVQLLHQEQIISIPNCQMNRTKCARTKNLKLLT